MAQSNRVGHKRKVKFKMEPDFSGWATKAGLKCSDGRTIMPDAFKDQDTAKVPLVWQHGHNDPENVLGHAILENRPEGVYARCYFNDTPKAAHARSLVVHKDITMMSIWANQLVEQSKRVFHGAIREVSLVLSGANPGAVIDNVTIRHSGGDEETLEDEAVISTGLPFEELKHSDDTEKKMDVKEEKIEHDDLEDEDLDPELQAVYDSMNDEQKELLHSMLEDALEHADSGSGDGSDGETIQDVYDSMSEKQKQVLHYMLGEALASAGDSSLKQDNLGGNNDSKGEGEMKHNVFEQRQEDGSTKEVVLSHSEIKGIVADATKTGSLKEAVEDYAIKHGIEDIDILFPDAQAITNSPEMLSRRVEWVAKLLGAVRKSPFSRIKTSYADITVQEARAKGYIKGTLKKEEFFRVAKRTTTPTTIYKKQKLDRDDIIDITDFDVVAWLKAEMRLMLDEELARAILVGDGRPVDDDDKIDEDSIRPIASDHELYTTTVNVNVGDASSSFNEVIDAITRNRSALRGTGLPIMFTTETQIANVMTLRDSLGRKIYKTLEELAAEVRVSEIVPVEVLEEYPDIIAILVNPTDYVVGATAGGQVSMFEDFDIDYNQQKYLIETRCSGALTRLKAAMVVRSVASGDVLVSPTPPDFDGTDVTITDTTGVVYRNADTDAVMNAAGSPYTVPSGETLTVVAEAADGYYVGSSADDGPWSFTNPA